MNGLLHIHTQPNGLMYLKFVAVILVVSLFLGGCSAEWFVGDGKGDWTMDLCAGYSIVKINSREIVFGYSENPDASGGSIIIQNYFVVAYQLDAPYILLEGIQTNKTAISDEELTERELSYYFVDTSEAEVVGPFECYDELVDYCSPLTVKVSEEWTVLSN